MRLMDPNEMLEVTEASAEARRGLAAQMAPLYGGKPSMWLSEAARSGMRGVYQITRGAVVIGVYWAWHSKCNKTLVVNAAGSLVKQDVHLDFFEAFAAQARILGCDTVQFQTARRGLVEKAQRLGYVPEGVVLSKRL
jgi:hypothetical protein